MRMEKQNLLADWRLLHPLKRCSFFGKIGSLEVTCFSNSYCLMPTLDITVSHQLTQAEATERLKKKRTEIKEENTYTVSDLKETWTSPDSLDFAFKVLGFSLTGTVESLESSVRIAVALPIAAMPMKGMIENQVRRELEQVLSGH